MNGHVLADLRAEIGEYLTFLKEDILQNRLELSEIIRICVLLKLMWLLSQDNSIKSARFKDCFNKRITDLMRSEFSTIKEDDENNKNEWCDLQDLVGYIINEPESLYITFIRNRSSSQHDSGSFLYKTS